MFRSLNIYRVFVLPPTVAWPVASKEISGMLALDVDSASLLALASVVLFRAVHEQILSLLAR